MLVGPCARHTLPLAHGCLELKEFKKQQVREGLCDLPPKQVIDPQVKGGLSIPTGNEHPYLQDTDVQSHFPTTFHSSSTLELKGSGLTASASLHFLIKAPMSHKTYIK